MPHTTGVVLRKYLPPRVMRRGLTFRINLPEDYAAVIFIPRDAAVPLHDCSCHPRDTNRPRRVSILGNS